MYNVIWLVCDITSDYSIILTIYTQCSFRDNCSSQSFPSVAAPLRIIS